MSNKASHIVATAAARLRAEPEREAEITADVLRALASVADPDRVDYGCHMSAHVEAYLSELTRERARAGVGVVWE